MHESYPCSHRGDSTFGAEFVFTGGAEVASRRRGMARRERTLLMWPRNRED